MDTSTTYRLIERDAARPNGTARGVRHILKKIISALTFNADAIFKSKDWPYIWPK
jgi:hypothetical protein